MSNYWERRLQQQQDLLYDKTQKEIEEILVKEYQKAFRAIQTDAQTLWHQIMREGSETRINNLYRYNRYFELMNTINSILSSLGQTEIDINNEKMTELYLQTGELLQKENNISFTLLTEQGAQKTIDAVWCADGKHWSSRVWDNKRKLQQRIERGLVDSFSRGIPKDEMVKELQKVFGVGFAEADRIARTELTNVQNQAAKEGYQAAGYTHYKFLAAVDDRTSDICQELNGKVFSFEEAVVGENFPPCHPNCRSTIIKGEKPNV